VDGESSKKRRRKTQEKPFWERLEEGKPGRQKKKKKKTKKKNTKRKEIMIDLSSEFLGQKVETDKYELERGQVTRKTKKWKKRGWARIMYFDERGAASPGFKYRGRTAHFAWQSSGRRGVPGSINSPRT